MRPTWILLAIIVASGCAEPTVRHYTPQEVKQTARLRSQNKVFQGAFSQLEKPASYDGGYYSISYPNGDVPIDRGACADVVVRALRHAGRDLQKLIHDDAQSNAYPRITASDTNIDHRRVQNQEVFFTRHGKVLTKDVDPQTLAQWKPGDIVCWRLPMDRPHTGIVSDTKNRDGVPYVIHNVGVVAEEDVLTRWKIVAHYRYP